MQNNESPMEQTNDFNAMFAFLIKSTSQHVIKECQAEQKKQIQALFEEYQGKQPPNDELTEEELTNLGRAVIEFIKDGNQPNLNDGLISVLIETLVQINVNQSKKQIDALTKKLKNIEQDRIKSLNDNNELRAVAAIEEDTDSSKKEDDTQKSDDDAKGDDDDAKKGQANTKDKADEADEADAELSKHTL